MCQSPAQSCAKGGGVFSTVSRARRFLLLPRTSLPVYISVPRITANSSETRCASPAPRVKEPRNSTIYLGVFHEAIRHFLFRIFYFVLRLDHRPGAEKVFSRHAGDETNVETRAEAGTEKRAEEGRGERFAEKGRREKAGDECRHLRRAEVPLNRP